MEHFISHIFFLLVTGNCKRKSDNKDQDEGKQSDNNTCVIDGEQKTYGLVNILNWKCQMYKTESEAQEQFNVIKNGNGGIG